MNINKNNVPSFDAVSSGQIKLLRICGMLPFEGRSFKHPSTKLLSVYFFVINLIVNTMYLGYGARMIKRRDIEVDSICEITIVQNVFFRYLAMSYKRNDLEVLMKMCKDFWERLANREETKTVLDFERKVKFFRQFFLWNNYILVTLYMITCQIKVFMASRVNATEPKVLPFKFYVDVQEQPMFTIVALFQGFVCYNISMSVISIDTTGPYLIMMACGYLKVLQKRFLAISREYTKKINDGNKKNIIYNEEILLCAKFHQDVIYFCKKIQAFTSSQSMITMLCNIYVTSLIMIKILEKGSDMIKYISLLVVSSTELLICQWSSELLLHESVAVSNAAYFASLVHPKYETITTKTLQFVILRAQKPIQLTAGGYVKLSMTTFGQIAKAAYSFFTVARNFGF